MILNRKTEISYMRMNMSCAKMIDNDVILNPIIEKGTVCRKIEMEVSTW
jgi:hypothetical protein